MMKTNKTRQHISTRYVKLYIIWVEFGYNEESQVVTRAGILILTYPQHAYLPAVLGSVLKEKRELSDFPPLFNDVIERTHEKTFFYDHLRSDSLKKELLVTLPIYILIFFF